MKDAPSSQAFHDELLEIVSNIPEEKLFQYSQFNYSNLPQLLMADVEAIGWSNVTHINDEFTVIKLKIELASITHDFEVFISEGHPRIAPTVHCNLPFPINFSWNELSSLYQLYSTVREIIKKHEDFFLVQLHLGLQLY